MSYSNFHPSHRLHVCPQDDFLSLGHILMVHLHGPSSSWQPLPSPTLSSLLIPTSELKFRLPLPPALSHPFIIPSEITGDHSLQHTGQYHCLCPGCNLTVGHRTQHTRPTQYTVRLLTFSYSVSFLSDLAASRKI